ncbi:MAG: GNAT family N-acetyltransferase [Bacillota bacterium]|nr:GNAT family N-acetyltransferase [Bacillota bacterium]
MKPFFRIKHECNEIGDYCLDERFTIMNVDTTVDLEKVSDLIGKCYEDIHPSVDTISQWTEYDVFEEDLWIWIIEKETNSPIALGIAELDYSVPEGSLEWIQVLPGYQGKGLGKILVLELLKRMHGKVDCVTVSGEVDNETNPERLYKSCGFSGDDIWWLLRK